jgi:hypothetical protein
LPNADTCGSDEERRPHFSPSKLHFQENKSGPTKNKPDKSGIFLAPKNHHPKTSISPSIHHNFTSKLPSKNTHFSRNPPLKQPQIHAASITNFPSKSPAGKYSRS